MVEGTWSPLKYRDRLRTAKETIHPKIKLPRELYNNRFMQAGHMSSVRLLTPTVLIAFAERHPQLAATKNRDFSRRTSK